MHSVKRDIRILEEHMKIKDMSHHQLSSFVARIEDFMRDLKKDKSPMSASEKDLLMRAKEKAQMAFDKLPKKQQDKKLKKRVSALNK